MTWLDWADSQTNRALQNEQDVSRAYVELAPYALPRHNERWKNWDAAIALAHLYDTTFSDGTVLDAGACRDPKYPSPFLPAAQRLGLQRLYGVNLDEKGIVFENGVRYEHGDITNLKFAKGFFDYIACLSVIEHGVDVGKFFKEMARVVSRGGYLFVSFDYWDTPIDTGDRTAFGAPVKIFSRDDVVQMVKIASEFGLVLTRPLNIDCQDPLVKWMGLEYTFCNLLLQRK